MVMSPLPGYDWFAAEPGRDDTAGPGVPLPVTVCDLLYLLSTHRTETIVPTTLESLKRISFWMVRGELATALTIARELVEKLERDDPALDDALAYLVFLTFMDDPAGNSWKHPHGRHVDHLTGASRVVRLCIESDREWHRGQLVTGLLRNHLALQYSQEQSPVWMLLSQVLLVKKLSDTHVPGQALSVLSRMQSLVDVSGLNAFEPVVAGLHSLLHLQDGRCHDALESATRTVSISNRRRGTVGVKLAMSVSAAAYVRLGDHTRAVEALASFDELPTRWVLFDSSVRNTLTRIALLAESEGSVAAADRIHEAWNQLGTRSGCFVEELERPAWLVCIARRAGDTELAVRCLDAIEQLARRNRGTPALEKSVALARAAFHDGDWRDPLGSMPHAGPAPPPARPIAPGSAAAVSGGGSTDRPGPERSLPEMIHRPPDPVDVADGAEGPLVARLTPRELEVARLVGRGLTNQQVATLLGISSHTVNYHLRGVFRKLSISTRVALASLMSRGPDRPEDDPPPPVTPGPER